MASTRVRTRDRPSVRENSMFSLRFMFRSSAGDRLGLGFELGLELGLGLGLVLWLGLELDLWLGLHLVLELGLGL